MKSFKAIRYVCIVVVVVFSAALSARVSLAQETGFTYIERELSYLMSIWPGEYDNQEQISFDARAEFEQKLGNGRFHAKVIVVDAPNIGDNLLYVEKSIHGDLNNTYQQRLYKLVPDESLKAIRVKAYAFKKADKYLGGDTSSKAFKRLRASNLIALEGCDLLLRRDNRDFAGSNISRSNACQDGEKLGYLERVVRVSSDEYSFNDRRYLSKAGNSKAAKSLLATTLTPRKMRRARWFACMIDVPKDTPNVSNFTQHYMKIHDQGGTFSFTHPDGRDMELLMRNTWSYGMQRETFFIGLFENDINGKLLIYSWGTPGADRIGMNPGYIRVQCDLDTPKNVELQKGLRVDS